MKQIPAYADEELRILGLRLPAFLLGVFSIVLGILTGTILFTALPGVAVAYLYNRYTEGQKAGFVEHQAYRLGLLIPKSRLFPPSFTKWFTS